MKLLRYGPKNGVKPGLLGPDGRIRDLSGVVDDLDGKALSPRSLERLRTLDPASLPAVEGSPRIAPCVASVSKIVGIGLNYKDHAAEAGSAAPAEPILFLKATSAISGPDDDVMLPKASVKMDYEVELGVVIGTTARYVAVHDALEHVAGYCVVNDVSEREHQLERLGQWTKGKSADTFAPIGPWLVTRDEVPDPQALELFTEVNGERRQAGHTREMIFPVAHLVSYVSHFMTLCPGDVIATGTPAGVGVGKKPPVFLKAGDEMRLWISDLGEQRQRVVPFSEEGPAS